MIQQYTYAPTVHCNPQQRVADSTRMGRKVVLNISKTKSIVFDTNHSLHSRPQLNLMFLMMYNVAVVQVKKTKLVVVFLDCEL